MVYAALAVATTQMLAPPVAPYSLAPLPKGRVVVPMIFPILGGADWNDTYGLPRGKHRHTGQDLRAPKMTPIVAPFSGRIGFKRFSFWIYGDNGYKCLGTHLNDDTPGTNDGSSQMDNMFAPNLEQGGRVIAGQLIGYVGNSTDATGPHLHFEIYSPKGIRNPAPSLKMAQRLSRPRPNLPWPREKPIDDEELWIVSPRWTKGEKLAAMVVARQYPGGKVEIDTAPNRVYLWVPAIDADLLATQKLAGVYVTRKAGAISVKRTAIY